MELFLFDGKNSFIFLAHKSGDTQNVKNHKPIFKLFILTKMFETITFKNFFHLLCNNISLSQYEHMVFYQNTQFEPAPIQTNLLSYHNLL